MPIKNDQALELISKLAEASQRHYRVVNGEKRGSAEKAAKDELKAARKVFEAMTGNMVTDTELETALNW